MDSFDLSLLENLGYYASWLFIGLGSFFTLVGAIGLMRMPDMFTRMHAASVSDTLGAGFLLLGLMLQAGLTLVTLKLVFILGLLFMTGPVAAHALAQAALHARVKPRLDEDRRARNLNDTDLARTRRTAPASADNQTSAGKPASAGNTGKSSNPNGRPS